MQVPEREEQNLNYTVKKRVMRELKVITLKLLTHFYTQSQCKKAAPGGIRSYR